MRSVEPVAPCRLLSPAVHRTGAAKITVWEFPKNARNSKLSYYVKYITANAMWHSLAQPQKKNAQVAWHGQRRGVRDGPKTRNGKWRNRE